MYDEIYFANMTESDREDERGDASMYFFELSLQRRLIKEQDIILELFG
jgi:hypothetical protein